MAKLDKDILEQLKTIFAKLDSEILLVVKGAAKDPKTDEVTEFMEDFASSSDRISVKREEDPTEFDAPVTEIWKEGNPTGVSFCGVPGGHEFSTLILAVLNASGEGRNLPDNVVSERITSLSGPAEIFTFVSLTCTNCPDVAQALNIVALLNPGIRNVVIDGGVVPQMVKDYNIQSVPAVFVNGDLLTVGRTTLGEILSKLEEKLGTTKKSSEDDATPLGFDAVIAGGGPAGAASAIYLARKGMNVAVVAGRVGGQVEDTNEIENLISVPLTTGPRLGDDIRKHLEAYGIPIFSGRKIESADLRSSPKRIKTDTGEIFEAPAVVIATGASWRKLNVAGESDYLGKGIAFCTHCDGPFFAGKRVAVVGGGNSGIEAAIDLASICTHVDVFEFLDTLKADDVLQKKLSTFDNVTIHLSSAVKEVLGDGHKVTGLRVEDRRSGEVTEYEESGVFVQIGLVPNSKVFDGEVPITAHGEIISDRGCRTSVAGVYAAGDVTDVPYKQIVIAMGEGAKAALSLVDDMMRGKLK